MSDKSYDAQIMAYIQGVFDTGGDFPDIEAIRRATVHNPGRTGDSAKIALDRLVRAGKLRRDSLGRPTFNRELCLKEEFYPPGTPGVTPGVSYFVMK